MRGFLLSFSVSSLITRLNVIFMFVSLFSILVLLIAAVFVINYGLECFANLGIAYISYFAHTLFEYKLVLDNLYLRSKHLQVFNTLSEFSTSISNIINPKTKKFIDDYANPCQ